MADMLIVDDDRDIRDLVTVILRMAGHEVREAPNGREGLDRVADRRPDVAVVDVDMPILNGPEMAYALFLRNAGDEKIPIILVSGAVGLPKLAESVGTPYFLAKPYSPDALLRVVDLAVKERIPPRPRLAA
jgi:CheY-like chemotaxis protein